MTDKELEGYVFFVSLVTGMLSAAIVGLIVTVALLLIGFPMSVVTDIAAIVSTVGLVYVMPACLFNKLDTVEKILYLESYRQLAALNKTGNIVICWFVSILAAVIPAVILVNTRGPVPKTPEETLFYLFYLLGGTVGIFLMVLNSVSLWFMHQKSSGENV